MEIEGREFGAGVQGCEGRGTVGGLLFDCGDYEVGFAVGQGA